MGHAPLLVSIVIVGGALIGTILPGHAVANAQLNDALAELRASDDEWQRSDAEFRSLRRSQEISGIAAEDFASFVADLQRKMLEDCQAFRELGGDPEALGFECELPEEALASEPELPQSPMSVQTEEEKTASLEAALDQSLGEFDETLQEKQSGIFSRRETRSWGGPYSDASDTAETGGSNGGGITASPGSASAQPHLTEPGAGPGVDKKTQEPITVSAEDSKVGAGDDDVVARQLREAAENETDPILKEKLWAEYRKYRTSKADSN